MIDSAASVAKPEYISPGPTQIPKTNVDKPMTYEMDSARKLNLKRVYDSNPTLQRKFKTFEKYLQQFMIVGLVMILM